MPLEGTQEVVALAQLCNDSALFLYNLCLYDQKITFAYMTVDW